MKKQNDEIKARSQFVAVMMRLRKNKLAMLGLAILLFMAVMAICADLIADYDTQVIEQHVTERLQKPSGEHWFGTDQFGRDVFARIVHGARISLTMSIIAMAIAVAIGAVIGSIAGYFGGFRDNILMRFMDILLAIPPMLMSISIVAALGQSMTNLLIALSIAYIPVFARVIRSSILSIKDQEFIEASRCCGSNDWHIIVKHIIPNAIGPIIVQATLAMGATILIISSLSFMGLGVKPPASEWGTMLFEGRDFLRQAPYLVLFPGAAITLSVISLNLLGDGLRDALDPRLKKLGGHIVNDNILKIENISAEYRTDDGTSSVLNNISLSLGNGETLGLVGETGAGKTTTALAIMGLLPKRTGFITNGTIEFAEAGNLLDKKEEELRAIRGHRISMIFQDPMTSLNPVIRVGDQIKESFKNHMPDLSDEEMEKKVDQMLEMVGIPAARKREYPHQFSGGMKQRVVIAIALSLEPELLIADEPTTALDVTIQAQVLHMMRELKKNLNTSMILITHDLGIVSQNCDKVAVMYAGTIVESGTAEEIFTDEKHHPYTIGLFGSIPDMNKKTDRLSPIDGLMPDPMDLPEGCVFHPRCPKCMEICKKEIPKEFSLGGEHTIRCHLFEEVK